MSEGIDYSRSALIYAEDHGIYEYSVIGNSIEYWSLYDDGFYSFRVNLDTNEREQIDMIPWAPGDPIPSFLESPEGWALYNYFEG